MILLSLTKRLASLLGESKPFLYLPRFKEAQGVAGEALLPRTEKIGVGIGPGMVGLAPAGRTAIGLEPVGAGLARGKNT